MTFLVLILCMVGSMLGLDGVLDQVEAFAQEVSLILLVGGLICAFFGFRILAWLIGLGIGGAVSLTVYGAAGAMESAPVAGDEMLLLAGVVGLIAGALVFRFVKRIHILVSGWIGFFTTMMIMTVIEPYYPTELLMKTAISYVGFFAGVVMLKKQSGSIGFLASSGIGGVAIVMGSSVLIFGASTPLTLDFVDLTNRIILFTVMAVGCYFQIYWTTRENAKSDLLYDI